MTNWYIARLAPGATRAAKNRPWREAKDGETAFELEMEEEGFACYLPKLRKEIIHHRTKKVLVRAFPLFTGYAFVSVTNDGRWPALRDCETVGSVLGVNGRPWPVSSDVVDQLRAAETGMAFDETRAARILRKQEGRTRRETTALQFPPGAVVDVSAGQFAGHHGSVVSVTGRGQVKVMLQMFGGLVPVEMSAGDLWQEAAE